MVLSTEIARRFFVYKNELDAKADEQSFVVCGKGNEEELQPFLNVGIPRERLVSIEARPRQYRRFFQTVDANDLVVFHGILDLNLWAAMIWRPKLWGRFVWVMWGGDVHGLLLRNKFPFSPRGLIRRMRHRLCLTINRLIIPRIGAVGALVPGDFDVLQSYCGKLNNYARLFYSDFVVEEHMASPSPQYPERSLRIVLGNSSSESNNHFEAIEWLSRFKNENITIFCPLSYGDLSYRTSVIEAGKAVFGEKFQPILDFMDREKYAAFLASMDILVFNHYRQQGLYVLHKMLLSGKKCFVHSLATTFAMLQDFKILVYPTENISAMSFSDFWRPLTSQEIADNLRQYQKHLSKDASLATWKSLFARFRMPH